MKKFLFVTFLLIFINSFSQSLQSKNMNQKKVALVIGVADYLYADKLRNPLNDERGIADSLKSLDFDVTTIEDPDLKTLSEAMDSFGTRIESADVCLLFYSGHGIEFQGTNYLIPKDLTIQSPTDLKFRAYPLDQVLGKIDNAKVKTGIVLLDACRNNPWTKSWGTKGIITRGLAPISYPTNGIFIGFAAAPGKTALDGLGKNGPYTEAILKFINEENLSINVMFTRIAKEVKVQTRNQQNPWFNTSLDDDFYFKKTGPDINNFTQEEFNRRVDTLVEVKLKEKEVFEKAQIIPKNIKKLFNANESVISNGLSYLLAEQNRNFTVEEVIDVFKAYYSYSEIINKETGIPDKDFITLLSSIYENQTFNDSEQHILIDFYNHHEFYDPYNFLLQMIDKSKSSYVTSSFKQMVLKSGEGGVDIIVLGRFLQKQNLQEYNFYYDYLNRLNKSNYNLITNFDTIISFFSAANIYKKHVIELLNDRTIVDSIFTRCGINYEDHFIDYRNTTKNKLVSLIDNKKLDNTYFFSTLCPCNIAPTYWRQGRKFPCRDFETVQK